MTASQIHSAPLNLSITLRCPNPKDIHLTARASPSAWNAFYATGEAVGAGHPPLLIAGVTRAAEVKQFDAMHLVPGDDGQHNSVTCDYTGQTAQHSLAYLVLAQRYSTLLLAHCRFIQGDPLRCAGDRQSCVLYCAPTGRDGS